MSRDPLSASYPWNSPYSFAEGGPIENLDLDGMEKVHYLFYIPDGRMSAPAKTREIEIKAKYPSDIVHRIEFNDLAEIADVMKTSSEKYRKLGYKTSEVTFFSHNGDQDGPKGLDVSDNIDHRVGNDPRQLDATWWQTIDFNFDPEGSIFLSLGCNGATFGEKTLKFYSELTHGGGSSDQSGDSYTYDYFTAIWIDVFDSPAYLRGELGTKVVDRSGKSELIQGNAYVLEGKVLINDSQSSVANAGTIAGKALGEFLSETTKTITTITTKPSTKNPSTK